MARFKHITERACDVCGRRFVLGSANHIYKHRSHYHCSWTCHRAYEKGEKIILKPAPIPVKIYNHDERGVLTTSFGTRKAYKGGYGRGR